METDLAIHISRATTNREEQDTRVWGNNENKCFSVKSAYASSAKRGSGPHIEVFKLLWKAKAFPNVTTTTWRDLLDTLPT